jgi:hypothetical protein
VQGGGGDSAHGGAQRVHTGAPDRPLSDSGGGSHLGPRCRASTWAQQSWESIVTWTCIVGIHPLVGDGGFKRLRVSSRDSHKLLLN